MSCLASSDGAHQPPLLHKQKRLPYRILFLNQSAGPLFRELAEDVSKGWLPCAMLTGHPQAIAKGNTQCLDVLAGPPYVRKNLLTRGFSWCRFLVKSLFTVWRQPGKPLLFIVSNPPFLGVVGLLFKRLRRQPYVVLVYDLYPDLLVAVDRLASRWIVNTWNLVNRHVFKGADAVFTIGIDMKHSLERKLGDCAADSQRVICIPCWANVERIRPIPKDRNWFAKEHGLLEKITVLYSGNMGYAHDIRVVLDAAQQLKTDPAFHFLFVGDGPKRVSIEKAMRESPQNNITLLFPQSEDVFPYSLASGDVGVVTYHRGTEGCMVPSKAYSYMAAGLAVLVCSEKENDLAGLVRESGVGAWVQPHDRNGIARVLRSWKEDKDSLRKCQLGARKIAEEFYSRANTARFIQALGENIPQLGQRPEAL